MSSNIYLFDYEYKVVGNHLSDLTGGANLSEIGSPNGVFSVGEKLVDAEGQRYTYLGTAFGGVVVRLMATEFQISLVQVLTYEAQGFGLPVTIVRESFNPIPVPQLPTPTDGPDSINVRDYHAPYALRLRLGDGDDHLYGTSGNFNDRVWGEGGDDSISLSRLNDWLFGGEGDDTLDGSEGHDRVYGGVGHDTLYGGEGDDRLIGGNGRDTIYGNNGNDVVAGGEGNDWIWAGYGINRLIFEDNGGVDTINRFELGYDILDFRPVTDLDSTSDLRFRDVSEGLLINYGSGKVLLLGLTESDVGQIDLLI